MNLKDCRLTLTYGTNHTILILSKTKQKKKEDLKKRQKKKDKTITTGGKNTLKDSAILSRVGSTILLAPSWI
jgi:hypothetical protein